MKIPKKAFALLAGVALAATGLVGCTDSGSTGAAGEPEAEVAEEVEEAAEEDIAEAAGNFLGALLAMAFGSDPVPEEAYEEADGEVADFFDKLEISKYLSFDDLTDEEAYEFKADFYYLAMMGMFDYDDGPEIKVTFPLDAVKVDGKKATVEVAKAQATVGGEDAGEGAEEMGIDKLHMVHDVDGWKVDAAELAESMGIELDPED